VSGRLAGLRILVTGGGSGIGRAVVERYLEDGATVTVLERSQESASSLQCEALQNLQVLIGDATNPDSVSSAIRKAADVDGRLDNLTCCVGVFDYYTRVCDLSIEELESAADEVWRVNVLSHLQATNMAYPNLRQGRGSITLTLSESAFHAVGGGARYGSSKWALRGGVAHLASELAPEVRVNGVAPGGTGGTRFAGLQSLHQEQTADAVIGRDETIAGGALLGITPQPEDHAAAYSYLADPNDARIVTGIVVNTDGGRRS